MHLLVAIPHLRVDKRGEPVLAYLRRRPSDGYYSVLLQRHQPGGAGKTVAQSPWYERRASALAWRRRRTRPLTQAERHRFPTQVGSWRF